MSEPPPADQRVRTFLIAGLVLCAITVATLWPASPKKPPTGVFPPVNPDMVPLVTGEEPIATLFVKAGCAVCHTIPGIPGADGRTGPTLVLGTTGPRRLADPRYHGQAKTVRDYIVESVLEPGVYVVSGYPDRVMPPWYGRKLSAAALDKIAAYLETVKDES